MDDGDVDEGILTAMNQLPVTQLAYGGSLGRFSFVLYKLGYLECIGKSSTAVYPSEAEDTDYFFKYYS